jgi:cytochrome P450
MIAAKYWEDPFTFKPERFLGDWNRDAFLPFSGGKCLGISLRTNLNTPIPMKVIEDV